MTDLIKRKNSPRLPHFDYTGSHIYFVTCTTLLRKPYFLNKTCVDIVMPVINGSTDKSGFTIYVYCFMPDHLHLLLCGREHSNLRDFMRDFKQKSAYAFRKKSGDILWQRSYYEHVLRRDEDAKEVARYILNNPVRAGFVQDFQNYPYAGSSLFDLKNL